MSAVTQVISQAAECEAGRIVADDIAYSLHDLDDFYRSDLLNQAAVSAEFRTGIRERSALAETPDEEVARTPRAPGHGFELLRRRIVSKDPWVTDDDAFGEAL